jgi:hypothetical protein
VHRVEHELALRGQPQPPGTQDLGEGSIGHRAEPTRAGGVASPRA